MDATAFCGWSFGTCSLYAVIVIVTNPAIIMLVINPAVIIDTNPAIIIVAMGSQSQLHFGWCFGTASTL